MLQYFIYLIFILTVALAAGGVFLSSRLRDKFHHEIFSTLLYFQVFIYTFGFYGIWGQAVIKAIPVALHFCRSYDQIFGYCNASWIFRSLYLPGLCLFSLPVEYPAERAINGWYYGFY